MTMLFVPAMLLIAILPVLALYAGSGGVLWLFGRRRQRRALRLAGTTLVLGSVVAAVVLGVGNALWFLLGSSIPQPLDSEVIRWLTLFLLVASGVSLVGPPPAAVARGILARPATGQ